jgi:hypothetical protein
LNHTDFMKIYVGHVDLELHFRNTLSNAKMSNVSNVDLDEWNKLAIHDFSSLGRLGSRKRACSHKNLKFQNLSDPNPLR